jgi:hypothetical protein
MGIDLLAENGALLIYKIAGALRRGNGEEETPRGAENGADHCAALCGRGRERAGSRNAPRNRQTGQLRAVFSVATCGVFLDTLR